MFRLFIAFLFVSVFCFGQKKQKDFFLVVKSNKKGKKIKEGRVVCLFLKNGIYLKGKLEIIDENQIKIKRDTVSYSTIKAICKYGIPKRVISFTLITLGGVAIGEGTSIAINYPNSKKTARAFIIAGTPYLLSGILIKQKHWRKISAIEVFEIS